MDFIVDLGIFALLLVFVMAFMGTFSTKIAEAMGGKKKEQSFDYNEKSKKGWKAVGGNNK
jgi:Na+-transporting methylmalonyl-CoA/oxaloacetate decarboxylase gamma subunit